MQTGLLNNGARFYGPMNPLLSSDARDVLGCGEDPKSVSIRKIAKVQLSMIRRSWSGVALPHTELENCIEFEELWTDMGTTASYSGR
jgi:hypothetical protein